MSERARYLAIFLLEEGMDPAIGNPMDYPPEDLNEYNRLRAEQQKLKQANRIVDQSTGEYTPEWQTNWATFERLRSKYNGMPPQQLNRQAVPPKASFYPSTGGPSGI